MGTLAVGDGFVYTIEGGRVIRRAQATLDTLDPIAPPPELPVGVGSSDERLYVYGAQGLYSRSRLSPAWERIIAPPGITSVSIAGDEISITARGVIYSRNLVEPAFTQLPGDSALSGVVQVDHDTENVYARLGDGSLYVRPIERLAAWVQIAPKSSIVQIAISAEYVYALLTDGSTRRTMVDRRSGWEVYSYMASALGIASSVALPSRLWIHETGANPRPIRPPTEPIDPGELPPIVMPPVGPPTVDAWVVTDWANDWATESA